ncbi:MAG: hypothetical protein RJA70_330 [Pseudomonadota bacterium]|jgi:hypothetical protein
MVARTRGLQGRTRPTARAGPATQARFTPNKRPEP